MHNLPQWISVLFALIAGIFAGIGTNSPWLGIAVLSGLLSIYSAIGAMSIQISMSIEAPNKRGLDGVPA